MLRLAIMTLGIAILSAGILATLVMVAVLIANGTANFDRVGHTEVPAGAAILSIAAAGVMVATLGWGIFLNGRLGPRKKLPRGGKHSTPSDEVGWSG